MNENSSVGFFAIVPSLGAASHKGGEGLGVSKEQGASLCLHLVSGQLSNCALGAQTQAGGYVFIRDISHQGSLLRVSHGFL